MRKYGMFAVVAAVFCWAILMPAVGDGVMKEVTCDENATPSLCDYLEQNEGVYQPRFDAADPTLGDGGANDDLGDLPIAPGKQTVMVTCMDARVSPYDIFDLKLGDSHVIRNAGGVVTDDALRSFAISQNVLATDQILVMHHFDCGMTKFTEGLSDVLEDDLGVRPRYKFETFTGRDPIANVRENVKRIVLDPFIPHKCNVVGAVYVDVWDPCEQVDGEDNCTPEQLAALTDNHNDLAAKYNGTGMLSRDLDESAEGKVVLIDVSDILKDCDK